MVATITGIDEPGVSAKGRLSNLSAHGLSLIVPGAVPTGITASVEWGQSRINGKIVYCRFHGNEFRVGLAVDGPIYDATLARKDDAAPDAPDREIPNE